MQYCSFISEAKELRAELDKLREECKALRESNALKEKSITNLRANIEVYEERRVQIECIRDSKLEEIASLKERVLDLERELFWVRKTALEVHRVVLRTGKAIWVRHDPEGEAMVKHLNESLGPISLVPRTT